MAHPDFARGRWRRLGCAPLVTEGAELEAVRSLVLERAMALGHRLTDDAAITLRADGRAIAPRRRGAALHVALPPGVRRAQLLSRSWVPAETDPASDDCRRLGIAVARLAIDGVPVLLDDSRLGAAGTPRSRAGAGPTAMRPSRRMARARCASRWR